MGETLKGTRRRIELPFAELLQAQENYALASEGFDRARRARDAAIVAAAAAGFTRRAIAEATNLTGGRVQQIIDEARR